MDSDLFVKKVLLRRDKIDGFNKYPFNIEVIKNFNFRTMDTHSELSDYIDVLTYNKLRTKYFFKSREFL